MPRVSEETAEGIPRKKIILKNVKIHNDQQNNILAFVLLIKRAELS